MPHSVRRERTTRHPSPPPITRSPSLPHNAPVPLEPEIHATRARTDMGTGADTSALLSPVVKLTPVRNTVPPAERNRRLSLDGDLPPAALRPDDASDSLRDDSLSEGLFELIPSSFSKHPIDISACSKAGWEPVRSQPPSVPATHTVEVRKENQDAFCVFAPFTSSTSPTTHDRQIFLGVFDGHGAEGRPIAHRARDYISSMTRDAAIKLAPPHTETTHSLHLARLETLKAAFSRAERSLTESETGIDHLFSGTTAVVAWLFGTHMYTAWTGDSRCVIGRVAPPENGRIKFKAVDTSHDQKPVRPDEKRRVRSAGGRIARWPKNLGPLRVWLPREWTPGLAMTRSIGDTVLSEYGVSPVPEVTYTNLTALDSFMVLASDGVWEFMSSQEVVDFVGRMRREGRTASDASEALVREAVRRWRRNEVVVDDTTAVVMWMNWGDHSETSEADSENKMAKGGDAMLVRPRKVFSMTRAKVALKPASMGVHLLTDDGQLSDFLCKNDLFQGI